MLNPDLICFLLCYRNHVCMRVCRWVGGGDGAGGLLACHTAFV